MIHHILLLSFQWYTSSEKIEYIKSKFIKIPELIPGIISVEWRVNNSPEMMNRNFTHGVELTFDSELSRSRYLGHPDHEALKEALAPFLKDIVIFDYKI
ncbi:Dabb family protein [Salmonella enterica subsp. enterica serovar Nigeria]|nr:Dabb family protein [Salmonella enterica subsp. enterica serovar Nigeria]